MATKTPLSLADYAALPEEGKRYELVEGKLVEAPFAKWRRARLRSFLLTAIGDYLRSNPVGETGASLGFILSRDPDTLRSPDAFFMTAERIAQLDADGWVEGGPDLAIEVLEASSDRGAVEAKAEQFVAAGTEAVWIVDPKQRCVSVVSTADTDRPLTEDDELTAPTLLPDFSVSVRELLEA